MQILRFRAKKTAALSAKLEVTLNTKFTFNQPEQITPKFLRAQLQPQNLSGNALLWSMITMSFLDINGNRILTPSNITVTPDAGVTASTGGNAAMLFSQEQGMYYFNETFIYPIYGIEIQRAECMLANVPASSELEVEATLGYI